jgi:hypothetical protein
MKNVTALSIRNEIGGVTICVKVVPNSSRDKVAGVLGDALKITTATPPEKGKANAAVAKILAKTLDIDSRRVTLATGQTSAHKEFHVKGITADEIRAKLQEM